MSTFAPSRTRRLPVVIGAVATVVVLAGVLVWSLGWGRDAKAPYVDAAAVTRLTLCHAGSSVTSGTVGGHPVDAVVGAASNGTDAGTTAVLFAYQPRQGVPAAEWTGIPLTAALPVGPGGVSALPANTITIGQFIAGYPAAWDGWVQLRLVVTSPSGESSSTYAAADLHLDGTHWTLADPGHSNCTA